MDKEDHKDKDKEITSNSPNNSYNNNKHEYSFKGYRKFSYKEDDEVDSKSDITKENVEEIKFLVKSFNTKPQQEKLESNSNFNI
jgi:hypothetical protein